jgi:hypothetical protein
MNVYDLTDLTGRRANEKRTVTFATVEFNRKFLLVGLASIIPGLILTGVFWPLVDSYALVVPPIVVGASLWLFASRTNDARRLPQYKALIDRRKAKAMVGKFVMGMQVVDPMMSDNLVITSSSVPVGTDEKPRLGDAEQAARVDSLFASPKRH